MDIAQVRPEPSEEEMAAIAAALEVLEQEAAAVAREAAKVDRERWRFSGRWWSRPTPMRRDRP